MVVTFVKKMNFKPFALDGHHAEYLTVSGMMDQDDGVGASFGGLLKLIK